MSSDQLSTLLPFPVTTPEGQELLSSGTLVTETLVRELASIGKRKSYPNRTIQQHGHLLADLEQFMRSNHYAHIFGGESSIRKVLACLGEIAIPIPLLEAIEQLKTHDYLTYRHSLIVFALSELLLEICPDDNSERHDVLLVGPTHDLGKLFLSQELLTKDTPLNREELEFIEAHTVAGYALLSYYLGDHLHPAAQTSLNHHERRNGHGYPRGIREIEPLVEMVSICDVYDALISPRPYRVGCYDNRTALEELSDLAEHGAMNWHYIQALISRNRTDHPPPETIEVSHDRRGEAPKINAHGQLADSLKSQPDT
mgnify:CR=1 FL=1